MPLLPECLRGRLRRAPIHVFAVSVPVLMRVPLPRLARFLAPNRTPAYRPARADATVDAVEQVLRRRGPLEREGCLTRGLTRYFFLSRSGMPVELCFGMGTPEREIEGHCWVLLDGEPYLESRDPRPVFTETFRIPAV